MEKIIAGKWVFFFFFFSKSHENFHPFASPSKVDLERALIEILVELREVMISAGKAPAKWMLDPLHPLISHFHLLISQANEKIKNKFAMLAGIHFGCGCFD